jgi:8-oxo-dGTP pyrophosphatase MutT (NUDIX family)
VILTDFINADGDGSIEPSSVVRQADDPTEPSHFGALCVRKRADKNGLEVLLITSRDSGRWVIPKGRPMRGHKPHQVARREAWEEAGVRGVVDKSPCGQFHYLRTLPQGGVAPCLVQVHVLDVASLAPTFPEMDERRLQWFRPRDAAAVVNEPELSAILLGATARPDVAGNL